jgi:hypothetical protein
MTAMTTAPKYTFPYIVANNPTSTLIIVLGKWSMLSRLIRRSAGKTAIFAFTDYPEIVVSITAAVLQGGLVVNVFAVAFSHFTLSRHTSPRVVTDRAFFLLFWRTLISGVLIGVVSPCRLIELSFHSGH